MTKPLVHVDGYEIPSSGRFFVRATDGDIVFSFGPYPTREIAEMKMALLETLVEARL